MGVYGNSDIRPFSMTENLSPRAPLTRIIVGKIARLASPGSGWCSRCGRPWTICEGHTTHSAFPLCEECHSELTPEQRLPHFRAIYEDWQLSAAHYGYEPKNNWPEIKRAVLAGE